MECFYRMFKLLKDYITLKPRYLFGLSAVCLVVAGLPKAWREQFGYDTLIQPYRGWIGLVGIAFLVYWIVMLVIPLPGLLLDKWHAWRLKKNGRKILSNLATDEKSCLAEYIHDNVSSRSLSIGDGVINALEKKRVVYRASDVSVHRDRFAYNLQPWVLEILSNDDGLKKDIESHYIQVV